MKAIHEQQTQHIPRSTYVDSAAPDAACPELLRYNARQLHILLRHQCSADDIAALFDTTTNRLDFYREAVWLHISGTLEKVYPVFVATLAHQHWRQLAELYFQAYPPDAYELNACVRQFPEFLVDLVKSQPWQHILSEAHVELALLEWHEWLVYVSQEKIPDAHTLTKPVLNPTLLLLQCRYEVSDFILAYRAWCQRSGAMSSQECAEAERQRPKLPNNVSSNIVFVYRNPETLLHAFCKTNDALLFAFKMVHDGLSLRKAAHAAGLSEQTIKEILQHAVAAGVVLLPASFETM